MLAASTAGRAKSSFGGKNREKLAMRAENGRESWFFVLHQGSEQTTVKKYTPLPLTRLGNFKAILASTVVLVSLAGDSMLLAGHPLWMGPRRIEVFLYDSDGLVQGEVLVQLGRFPQAGWV